MKLNDATAVVTGAASGLGRAVAERIVAEGGRATLFDVDEERGAEAAEALGERANFARVDVSDEAQVDAALAAAAETMGGVNVAVNCAGILGAGRVLGASDHRQRGLGSDDHLALQRQPGCERRHRRRWLRGPWLHNEGHPIPQLPFGPRAPSLTLAFAAAWDPRVRARCDAGAFANSASSAI